MNTRLLLHRLVFLLSVAATASALAQGSLTPPGAPAPTMKSLDQIEPRTPLVAGAAGVTVGASGTITISQSGSYYLTGNLTVTTGDGITVNADGVTLDLRGFTIRSSAAAHNGNGIGLFGSNIAIFNGHIVSGTTYNGTSFSDGPGFTFGILTSAENRRNIRVRDLTVQGVRFHGINITADETSLVESCIVDVCGISGIVAGQVKNCTALACGTAGITGQSVFASRGESIGGDGIKAVTVSQSIGISSGIGGAGDGIEATQSVDGSYGLSADGHGINCEGNVSNSFGKTTATNNSADGIFGFRNVTNSYGETAGDDGIDSTGNVSNSFGFTDGSGSGIEGQNVLNCYGVAGFTGDDGIRAAMVSNSHGSTAGTGDGIEATYNVTHSYGNAGTNADDGIDAGYTVSFSRGNALGADAGDNGIECTIAIGCTFSGGISATQTHLQ